jgi:hypothetical protein
MLKALSLVGGALTVAGLCTAAANAATIVNGGFEDSRFTPSQADYTIIDQSQVTGWFTTASDGQIELWSDGFQGVTAFEGDQFAELNANQTSTLYQDVSGIAAGARLSFGFAHRGRLGIDTLRLSITDLGADNVAGSSDDKLIYTSLYSDGTDAWGYHTSDDLSALFAFGNTMRFGYESVSAAGGNNSIGNFLDAASFGTYAPPAPVPVPAALPLLAAGLGVLGLVRQRQSA